MSKQLRRYQFTRHIGDAEDTEIVITTFKNVLKKSSRRWCFQLEKAPSTGKLHLQGRVSFKTPKRKSEAKIDAQTHVSPESDTTAGDFYVQKEETRIDGPWSDKDVDPVSERAKKYWLKHPNFNNLQSMMWNALVHQNERQILFVYDPTGGRGKSTFIMRLVIEHGALQIPPTCQTAEDMIQFAFVYLKDGQFVVMDIPRAVNSEQSWNKWLSALETLKNGYVYDKRYAPKFKYVAPPRLMVTCNSLPPPTLLTRDRYCIIRADDVPN